MKDTQPQTHVRWQPSVGGQHVSLEARTENGYDGVMSIAVWDEYPSLQEDDGDIDLEHVLDALEALDDETRQSIERTVIAGMSLAGAATELDWQLSSGHPDKKRVMRARDRGLRVLAELLGAPETPPVLPLFGHVNEP